MSGSFEWPPAGSSSNPSIGTNGSTAPTSSTEVGGINPSGNLQPLQTDSSGNLKVSLSADPIDPLGINLEQYGGVATTLGQKVLASSIPVAIASNQSTLPISATALPLPTGASTSALQSNVQSAPGTPQTIALTVQGNASGVAIPTTVASLPLPTGAATAALQSNVQSAAGTSAGTLITVQGSATGVAQPISATSLPLPTGAATSALQSSTQGSVAAGTAATASTLTGVVFNTTLPTLTNGLQAAVQADSSARQIMVGAGTAGTAVGGVLTVQGIASGVAQPISAAALPLPTGAATAASQTNVQSAPGTAQTVALTIQGNASGISLPITPGKGTLTDGSGTTSATINTSTQIFAANAARKYLLIQNVGTATIWINFTTAAAAGNDSFQLLAGGSFVMESGYISTEVVNVISSTASVPFTAKQG